MTWLDQDCHLTHTADKLGVDRNSLPARLAAAGALMRQPLLTAGAGAHRALWPLAITGYTPGDALPDPTANSRPTAQVSPSDSGPGTYRVYDYLRGGKDHYISDQEFGERLAQAVPRVAQAAEANRVFTLTAPRYLAEALGIRQFLDVGAGRPSTTQPNLHDVVHEVAPDARVVYVDHDPLLVAQGTAHLAGQQDVVMVKGDLREPKQIMTDPQVTQVLDLSQPVALCLHTVLHYLLDEEDPRGLVTTMLEYLPPGSFVSMTHGNILYYRAQALTEVYRDAGIAVRLRSRAQILDFVDGLDLVEPGMVPVQDWAPPGRTVPPCGLPDPDIATFALVARKT